MAARVASRPCGISGWIKRLSLAALPLMIALNSGGVASGDARRGEILTFMQRVADWQLAHPSEHKAQFEPAVRKAWTALTACVDADGKLTHVQPIGADPKKFEEDATEIYGVGAFLLAGSEVYRMIPVETPALIGERTGLPSF